MGFQSTFGSDFKTVSKYTSSGKDLAANESYARQDAVEPENVDYGETPEFDYETYLNENSGGFDSKEFFDQQKRLAEEYLNYFNSTLSDVERERDALLQKYSTVMDPNIPSPMEICYLKDDYWYMTPEEYITQLISDIDPTSCIEPGVVGFSQKVYDEKVKYLTDLVNKEYTPEFCRVFEETMGMSYEDYKNKLNELNSDIASLKASKYALTQRIRELPYIELAASEDFINFCNTFTGPDVVDRSFIGTEEDRMMVNYLYYNHGGQSAVNKYFEDCKDKYNRLAGLQEAHNFIANITGPDGKVDMDLARCILISDKDAIARNFATGTYAAGKGLIDGIETFGEGLLNIFATEGMISVNQYAQMYIIEALSGTGAISGSYELGLAAGNMVPAMAVSAVVSYYASPATGSLVGSILMGGSAGGNAKNQALVSGHDLVESTVYGGLIGLSETTLGYFLGKMPGLSHTSGFSLKNFFLEGLEEGIQDWVDAGLRANYLHEAIDWSEIPQESLKSFLMGAVLSGIFSGGDAVIGAVINNHLYNINVTKLMELLKTNPNMSMDEALLRVAGVEVNNQPSNKVFNAEESSYVEILTNPDILELFLDFENHTDIFPDAKESYLTGIESIFDDVSCGDIPSNVTAADLYVNMSRIMEANVSETQAAEHGFQIDSANISKIMFRYIANDINRIGFMSNDIGEALTTLYSNPNYTVGIHLTGYTPITDTLVSDIFNKGLINNGHIMQGATFSKHAAPSITLTVAEMNNLVYCVRHLKAGSSYKRSQGAVILLIPSNYEQVNSELHYFDGNGYRIKPDYIFGFVDLGSDNSVQNLRLNENFNVDVNRTILPSILEGHDTIGYSEYLNSTSPIVPISTIIDLLNNPDTFAKFQEFDSNKDFFEDISKQALILNVDAYVKEITKKGTNLDAEQTERYNKIMGESTAVDSIIPFIPSDIGTGFGPNYRSRSATFFQTILENQIAYDNFFNNSTEEEICMGLELFHEVYMMLVDQNVILNFDMKQRLETINNVYERRLQVRRDILRVYSQYGANQNAVRVLVNNPNANPTLYAEIENIVRGYRPDFSKRQILKFLRGIDVKGICSYATYLNEVLVKYNGREADFKADFGYDMFRIENGIKVVNAEVFFTDIYSFLNCSNPRVVSKGILGLRIGNDSDAYCLSYGVTGKRTDLINAWLATRNSLVWKSDTLFTSNFKGPTTGLGDQAVETIQTRIKRVLLQKRATIEIDIFSIDNLPYAYTLYSTNPSVYNNVVLDDKGLFGSQHAIGHSMMVTGMTDTGDLFVSSWGREFLLKFDEIRHRNLSIYYSQ